MLLDLSSHTGKNALEKKILYGRKARARMLK
jgi:hypothetical protein